MLMEIPAPLSEADFEYLQAVQHVLTFGTRKENRTSVDTLSTFNINYKIDLRKGFPLLTTKFVSWKNIVVEMLWFLSGQTNIDILKRHNCKFWDAWADPKTGEVPSAYGNFWRQFPTHKKGGYQGVLNEADFMDQLARVVQELKANPMSRRMVVSAWAPHNAWASGLPPCHCLFIVNVQNMHLDGHLPDCKDWGSIDKHFCLHLTQRSCDMALGVPYNIASYGLLMHLLSRFSGIPVGIFGHTLVDAHIYTSKLDGSMADMDHVPGLKEQLGRDARKAPTLRIDPSIKSLDDIPRLLDLPTSDLMELFKLEGYDPHPEIKFKVAV